MERAGAPIAARLRAAPHSIAAIANLPDQQVNRTVAIPPTSPCPKINWPCAPTVPFVILARSIACELKLHDLILKAGNSATLGGQRSAAVAGPDCFGGARDLGAACFCDASAIATHRAAMDTRCLVLPGVTASYISTRPLRTYLKVLGYAAHDGSGGLTMDRVQVSRPAWMRDLPIFGGAINAKSP